MWLLAREASNSLRLGHRQHSSCNSGPPQWPVIRSTCFAHFEADSPQPLMTAPSILTSWSQEANRARLTWTHPVYPITPLLPALTSPQVCRQISRPSVSDSGANPQNHLQGPVAVGDPRQVCSGPRLQLRLLCLCRPRYASLCLITSKGKRKLNS